MTQSQMPFADLELARRIERAEGSANASFVETHARLNPETNACWRDVGGTYAMFDGPASPVTQTFGLTLFETATDERLAQIEEFFTERGAPVFHEVSPLGDQSVLGLLHDRGYRPVELSSILVQPLASFTERPGLDGTSCRLAHDGEAQAWCDASAAGWDEFSEFKEIIRSLAVVNFHKPDQICVAAERDGRIIATGAMFIHEGIALLAGASTVPGFRQQGAQNALLDYRLRLATEHGCDLALMATLPGVASQRNAERNGFRIVYTRTKWGKNFP
jgi:hypothetical protein